MMNKVRSDSFRPQILLLLFGSLMAGCFGSGAKNAVHYYLVDPVAVDSPEPNTGEQLAVELIDLHIPQYLQRFQIVTRDGENRLRISENNQWGENLRKNLLRTLAFNLASRLSTIDIGTPLNRSASLPDYRVQVYVGKFELDTNDRVKLVARWQLTNAEEQELGMYDASLQSDDQIKEGDYDQIVADMQDLFARLCDRITASIMAMEGDK